MRLGKLDLNLFVVFEVMYRQRSVTKAALELNQTQPAISNALGRLRKAFDDPLFQRSPEGMQPTPVAEGVIGDVREALELLGRSVHTTAYFDPLQSDKTFHLGMNDLAEFLLLPALKLRLKEVAPNMKLTSYYVERKTAAEDLRAGVLDLLIDAPVINPRELLFQPLQSLLYVVAMRPDHPLAGPAISQAAYLQAEHLHVSSRRRGRGQVDLALHTMGHTRNVSMRVQSYLVASRITEKTDLLWTVPKVLADSLPLMTAPLPFAMEDLNWQLYWHKQQDDDPANAWLRNLLSGLVSECVS